jgi:hypothetical protein
VIGQLVVGLPVWAADETNVAAIGSAWTS